MLLQGHVTRRRVMIDAPGSQEPPGDRMTMRLQKRMLCITELKGSAAAKCECRTAVKPELCLCWNQKPPKGRQKPRQG
jgi:hypothetical protein